MGRRIARLTLDNLRDLPDPCASCAFWELDPVARARAQGCEAQEKAAWVSTVLREWGSCGSIAYVDDRYAGHALYAPPVHVPGAHGLPTAPVSADAVLLASLRVDLPGGGLGRVLIQSMAKDLIRRKGVRAVEAFGASRAAAMSGSCVVPMDFLLSVGFATQREHAAYPRMRMDLRSAVTWRDEFESALERLLPQRRPTPRPAERATR